MMKHFIFSRYWVGVAFFMLGLVGSVIAQPYPNKPVMMVVPFAAGGPTDVVARQLAKAMEATLGGTVLVDNKVGAGGTLASEFVAKAPPDGYTILINHIGMATAPALYRQLRFNPLTDYEYIGEVIDVPMTLVGRKDLPPNNWKELLVYMKENTKTLNLANAGLGAASHLCGLLLMSTLSIDMQTVSYKGTGPAMTDLQGGQVDLLCDQTTQTTELIKSKRIKAYGATSKQRVSSLPDLPTLQEQGLANFEVVIWHGLYAPRGTPKPITEKLNQALKVAVAHADFKSRMDALGALAVSADRLTPEGLRRTVKSEIDKWGPIIKRAGQYAD